MYSKNSVDVAVAALKKGYEEGKKKDLRIIMMECVMRMLSNVLHEQKKKRDGKNETEIGVVCSFVLLSSLFAMATYSSTFCARSYNNGFVKGQMG